jgi:hypothetical protein
MKVLMTQRALVDWAGTEMLTIEVANELAKRGHEVSVYSPHVGFPASAMIPSGVWVRSRLSDLPWAPDVIHGHHHLQAMAVLGHFVDSPAIYCSHGIIPWPELVPVHGRIYKYIVMCASMAPGLETSEGIPRDRILVIPNFVNTRRFSEVRKAPAQPTKAVLFGGSGFSPFELLMLERACSSQGISLERIGYAYGNPRERPEAFLPDFDLVFAIGRCALEALACGCAVIPIVPGQAGALVSLANFDDYAFSNLSPRYLTSGRRISEEWLAAELASYSPELVTEVTSHVRSTRTLTDAVDRLEQAYRDAINEHERQPARDKREFARYLEGLSASVDIMLDSRKEVDLLRADLASKMEHIGQLHQALSQAQQDQASLRAQLDQTVSQSKADPSPSTAAGRASARVRLADITHRLLRAILRKARSLMMRLFADNPRP